MIAGTAFTVRLSCLELAPNALLALTVIVTTPDAVGVPPIVPVDACKLSPAGNVPLVTAHVIGVLPLAVRVTE